MHRRKIYISILAFVLAGIGYVWVQYYSPSTEEAGQVDIGELIAMFQDNEQLANATYTEKIIEVEGVVEEISFLNDRHTVILKGDKFAQSFILCDMAFAEDEDAKEKITKGDTIKLKGVCKGYLLDVIMLNCVPIDEKD